MFQSAVIRDAYEFTGHNSALGTVCYNRHQDTFVSVDEACLRLWRAPGGQLRLVNLPARTSRFIQAIAYIDARQLFVASALDGALRLYDPNLNELAALFTGRGTVLSMVFDGVHNRLLTGGVDGCMAWQIKPRPPGMPEGALNPQYEFTPLPKFFSSRGRAFKEPKAFKTLTERAGWVEGLQLIPESNRIYAQTRYWIDVYSTVDGVHLERCDDLFPGEYGTLTAFVVQERAKYLVCGTSSGVIAVLSRHPLSIVHIFKDHTQMITSLAEHASSRLIISSSLDGSVRLWDLEARRQAHRLNVGNAVHALQLLPQACAQASGANSRTADAEMAGRFCCQLRNTVKIYDIHSILKEHQPCLVPVSILQRVLFPITPGQQPLLELARLARKRIKEEHAENNKEDSSDSDSSDDAARKTHQLIVVACMDKTLRIFAGRTASEAPSFTWIPDEQALDLVSFALHPVSHHLFLLLSSQKLLVVNAAPRRRSKTFDGEDEDVESSSPNDTQERARPTTSTIERVIDLHPSITAHKLPNQATTSRDVNNDSSAVSTGDSSNLGSTRAKASTGGAALRCICVCPFPPVFQAAQSPGRVINDTQSAWLSRPAAGNSATRRRQSHFTSAPDPPVPLRRRNAVVPSEWEWIACGSDLGQLLFWHTGLRGGRETALSLDAHDEAIVDISASASSPAMVTLDTAGRVHVWSLQPTFGLRHVLELGQSPCVFVLSPLSEIILSGFDDGRVVFHALGPHASYVDAFTGADDHHSTTVSAGDFLDERSLVLTASVDAVVKVWDQQRNLLRQVTLSTAVTSLCFLNADGDLLAGLTKGTFVISRRDVLPDKMPKPAPKRRFEAVVDAEMVKLACQAPHRVCTVAVAKQVVAEPSPVEAPGDPDTPLPPQKNDLTPRTLQSPESAARLLLAHVIQRPIEAANHLRPPVLRTLTAANKLLTNRPRSRINNSAGRKTAVKASAPDADQEEDWRDRILPLPAYQKLMRDQRSLYRRKKSQIPSTPVMLRALESSPRVASMKTRLCGDSDVDQPEGSSETPNTPLGLGVGSAEAPLLYCKHQAPVPPKDKTPRKLWNAIGGEDRRLIVLQRNRLPPC